MSRMAKVLQTCKLVLSRTLSHLSLGSRTNPCYAGG